MERHLPHPLEYEAPARPAEPVPWHWRADLLWTGALFLLLCLCLLLWSRYGNHKPTSYPFPEADVVSSGAEG